MHDLSVILWYNMNILNVWRRLQRRSGFIRVWKWKQPTQEVYHWCL